MDKPNFSKTKALFLDFDGVVTNNKVITDSNGVEYVQSDRSDSLGIEMLRNAGIYVAVISKEKNEVVTKRCEKLKIDCIQGVDHKINILKDEVKKINLSMSEVCFVGNDINDIECIQVSGIGVAPADSCDEVKKIADYVTKRNGGDGCVREIADLILSGN